MFFLTILCRPNRAWFCIKN